MIINGLTVLIVAVLAVLFIIGVVITARLIDRAEDSPKAPRRETPRSRARGTRARRPWAARRRARATLTWARWAIAVRLHGITITPGGDEPFTWSDPVRKTIRPDLPAPEPHLPEPEPTRKATGAELRDARLDYAPAPPFAQWESDTFVGGMKAVT